MSSIIVAGIIGTGLIGKKCVQKISGLVSKVLCFDAYPANDWIKTIPNAEYVSLEQLFAEVRTNISLTLFSRYSDVKTGRIGNADW